MSVIVKRLEFDPRVQRYKYFWLKYVQNVNTDEHCQKCLIGPGSKVLTSRMVTGTQDRTVFDDLVLDNRGIQFMYLCGVTEPYDWKYNFHLPMVVQEGGKVVKKGAGITIELEGCVELSIDPKQMPASHKRYRDYWYRSCRNVQFAWGFKNGLYLPGYSGQQGNQKELF